MRSTAPGWPVKLNYSSGARIKVEIQRKVKINSFWNWNTINTRRFLATDIFRLCNLWPDARPWRTSWLYESAPPRTGNFVLIFGWISLLGCVIFHHRGVSQANKRRIYARKRLFGSFSSRCCRQIWAILAVCFRGLMFLTEAVSNRSNSGLLIWRGFNPFPVWLQVNWWVCGSVTGFCSLYWSLRLQTESAAPDVLFSSLNQANMYAGRKRRKPLQKGWVLLK